jgi:hypothetical protein
VKFEAWNSTLTARPYPSSTTGNSTTPNNFWDGKGYDDPTQIPQFLTFRIGVRQGADSGQTNGSTNLHLCVNPYEMSFKKGAWFSGGFAFLGLAETLKYISQNVALRAASFVYSFGGTWAGSATQVNGLVYNSGVDAFIASIRSSTGFTGGFSAWSDRSVIDISSRDTDSIILSDCIYGPGLPMHKDALGGDRSPYINVKTSAKIQISNIYLRGNTTITSAGMGLAAGIPIENSNAIHYGSAVVLSPYTYRQFYHTFIGTLGDTGSGLSVKINIQQFGGAYAVRTGAVANGSDYNFYADLTGKLLPNHVHLVTNASTASSLAYPTNDDDGPFLDQFIHAKTAIAVENAFPDGYTSITTFPVRSGFLGKFGSNGHNSTKTRGILLGAFYLGGTEGGSISLMELSGTGTIFKRAGVISPTYPPSVPGSAGFGEANPTGSNPVITTKDNGSTTLDLNLGLRTWRAGISSQYGSVVKPDRSVTITV